MFYVDAQFAGARAEQIALHADDVAQIDQLVNGEIALGEGVFLDVDLQALAILRQVREARLAHAAQGLDAPGNAHMHRYGKFFRSLRLVFGQNGGDRVGEFEALAVGPETQRLDLANALQALLQKLVFQGQIVLLTEFGYYRSSLTRSISIIIPAYNEEKRLPAALRQVIEYLKRGDWPFAEILVVDDGSTDDTAQVAEGMQGDYPNLRLLRNPGNRGKGYAVRHGMLECRAEWALFTDADLSAPIAELETLWQAI